MKKRQAVRKTQPRPTGVGPARLRTPGGARPVVLVGIGASAGGLEALESFLGHLPTPSGMAFAVVQHLDPTGEDLLVGILQRACAIPVVPIADGTRVAADHVYVLPPGKDLSLVHGVLHLLPLAARRGVHLPIDFFLRTLAEDLGERSVGVVLSGMGSDGTAGLRAIHDRGGAAFVQEVSSAKFGAMPASAIDAGLADRVAPVEELPALIVAHVRGGRRIGALPGAPPVPSPAHSALAKVVGLLRTATGHDFTLYKASTLERRLQRRMGQHQIDDREVYVRYLRENPKELDLLFHDLLIGVTSFFRDAAAWRALEKTALPALLAACPEGARLRAWVPACSTGEEAYSLAMAFREAVERSAPPRRATLEIFATDLDARAVTSARQGTFPAAIADHVSAERLARHFTRDGSGYRVRNDLRQMLVFAAQDVLQDPPFTRLNLLSCRNLLIYLTAELQRKLLPMFHYSLLPGGVLFLGSAESVGAFGGLFAPVDLKARLYRRVEPVAGAPVPPDLPTTFVRPVEGPLRLDDKTAAAAPGQRAPEEELESANEQLQSANQELQSANEELQSTNEELTTSKEEMQSMNEELQTLNRQLVESVDELSRVGSDMKNLLDSTEIAVVFLDGALNVRRFTPQAARLIRLIPGDIGRPLADLASQLEYPAFDEDARAVLRTLVIHDTTVPTRDRRCFGVRIMPYRTIDNRIDGLVITFSNLRRPAPADAAPPPVNP